MLYSPEKDFNYVRGQGLGNPYIEPIDRRKGRQFSFNLIKN